MKICIIAEGCYPYVVGGVSGWINNLICSFPRVSFSVLAIISDRSISKNSSIPCRKMSPKYTKFT